MQIGFSILLFILGACFGSFLCCQVRRAYHSGHRHKSLGPRSVCLSCKYRLKWHDNIPIISWLLLRGKCRKCHKKIGLLEILSEVGLAMAFLLLSTTINVANATVLEWVFFITILLFTLILSYLAIYDGAYGELPTIWLFIAIFFAIVTLAIREWSYLSEQSFSAELIWQPLLSILILGGLYLSLYLLSKGKWVGDGDWLLGTAISITLFYPWLSLLTLFVSNFLATIVMYPITRTRKSPKIHFGPFLVIAFVVIYAFSDFLCTLVSFA